MRTDQQPLRIALFAPEGRMGRAIAEAVAADPGFAIDNDHANTSLGVALLADLVERAARVLKPADWDIEIAETHHRLKADALSGTALLLGEAARRGRGGEASDERGRDGTGLKREAGAIGYAALRGGSVAGDHDVLFLGPGERVILSHRAESRAIFAQGALTAARFLHGKPPGLYTMADVIAA